ncbi:MAG: aminoglycoside phosphotransferase family protein [Pseudonocardiaceae bacterium]
MNPSTAHGPDHRERRRAADPAHTPESAQLRTAVRRACLARGLDATGTQLLHHYNNAVMLLPNEGAVARVATRLHNTAQIKQSQQVTRWLTEEHGFPATRPLPGAEPVELEPTTTISFWVYYPQPTPTRPLTSAHLGPLLAELHAIPPPPCDLRRWIPLDSLDHALRDDTTARALDAIDRHWLLQRLDQVRDELAALEWPLGHGLIHGDAWAGNLLWAPNTTQQAANAVLGDWDRVSHGPREVDLIPTWHAARRYGKGPAWTRDFTRHYGHDLTGCPGLPTLLTMRDLAQITGPLRRAPHSPPHAKALRQRLDGLQAGDTTTIWTAL